MNQELERFEPAEVRGRIAYEHLHRYAMCRDRVAGQRVLDVACGAGYGTNILAEVASTATGLDIDSAAIRKAAKKYRRGNLSFVTGDCRAMPFEDASFDAVVANEMIEHIKGQDEFLKEVARVLRPGGTLLISTPNKPIYNRYKPPNPFHVAEMTIPQFRRLLKRQFEHVHLTGLRMALVSAGFDLDGEGPRANLAAAKTYRGVGQSTASPAISNDELRFKEPEYVLAACSDQPIEDGPAHSTVFFSNEDDLWLEHEKIMAWASQLHDEDEALRADLREVKTELDQARNTEGDNQHLLLSSRLMGRLTGSQVDADPVSLIEAMFSLNELIVQQRARLEALASAESRVVQLEHDLEEAGIAHGQLAELRQEHAKLSAELDSSRAAQEQLAEEVRRAHLRTEELQRQNRQRHEDRDKLARQLEERAAKLEQELKEAQASLARLSTRPGSSDAAATTGVPGNDPALPVGKSRRSHRLDASHREIWKQLGRAREVIAGAIPPTTPTRQSLLARLAGSPRPYVRILFDRQWIERQAPDAGNVRLGKFLKDERFYHIDPHPLFSARYYLQRFPDVAAAKISPFQHYIEHGWREGRDPHPYFTNDWYLEQNPDVLHAGQNPLIHYLEHGWREGRRPNPVFDPLAYLNRHPDVEAAGIEPLTHFVMYGLAEGRDIPFQNLERDWRSLVAATDSPTLMDHLLSETPRLPAAVQMEEAPADSAWPPKPLNDHWMPQALRNFMIERGWEDQIPLFSYLYSVMDAYADAPEDFASSHACRLIVERARKLSAERATRPADLCSASIIIPVYNNVLDTLLCLVSLLEMKPSSSFEILVADDCSSDSTPLLMAEIGGVVRHIRNAENLGFVNNCNAAAQLAAGQSIVLLNNDTLVLPGWLDHLLTPLKRFEDVGLVGSKLINWDGTLQEAGGIAWKDGSAWNFGRGRNPVEPEFNYLRDVDYCSGASLALRADLWRELHGFDADFSPAYCEDSDLAFRVRDAGLRTIYSPRSELIHHEGRSHGRDTTAGIKGYQIANQKRLFERWKSVLEREHFANGENLLWARDRSATKPHILVIDHYVPQHDKDAGSRTMFQFLEVLLDAGWAVTFWPENLYYDPEYTKTIQEIGVEVIYGLPFVGKFSDFLRQRKGLYDAVLLSRPHVAANFIDDVRTLTDARVLYYGHDVHFERMKAQREITGSTLEENDVEAMRVLELGLCDRCDVVLYPSEEEARLMQGLVDPGVQSVSVPAYRYSDEDLLVGEQAAANVAPSDGSRVQLLFVGGFSHGPNGDGVRWFCREVAPILRSEGFSFDLKIAGSNPTADVWELESDDVHVLGFVPDEELRDLYRAATVVIAPLRFGAGVKGKVIEAMAAGVPVVTTRVGAQGLRAADEFLFLGDTPEQFVAALRAAVRDENARAKAERALKYVRTHYSQAAMTRVFEQVLASCHFVSKAA